jgi:succinate dehydrogenase hydrophobic anchor subunit
MDAPREEPKKGRIRIEWGLARLDHASAWVSAVVLILYIVSGYGMTRATETQSLTGGLMTPARAFALHNGLFIPLLVTFVFHTFMGMRRALVRATKKKRAAGWIAAGTGALVLAYFLVLGA